MIKAAGVLFVTPQGRGLFLLRGNGGDYPFEYCVPGGRAEEDEDAEATAIRETLEESGKKVPKKDLMLLTRSISPGQMPPPTAMPVDTAGDVALTPEPAVVEPPEEVDFTTFAVRIDEEFTPVLCDEHVGYAWAPLDKPPQPLHPGCQIALERLTMNELDLARAMAAGRLTSPQRYANVTLWNIRLTGTGLAYRSHLKERVWRDPSIYMNEDFLARCNGLLVIMEHPQERATVDSKEFKDRVIGTVFLPYLKEAEQEVWAIAKVYDDTANEMMDRWQLSTSPAVVLGPAENNEKVMLSGGNHLLIEGEPTLLDHVAVCPLGTWDVEGEPIGVRADSAVPDQVKKAETIGRLDSALVRIRGFRVDVALKQLEDVGRGRRS